MNLSKARVLLTGATGGIGRAVAEELLEHGASVLLTGTDREKLRSFAQELGFTNRRVSVFAADLRREEDRARLIAHATQWQDGVNVLINNAGLSAHRWLEDQAAPDLGALVALNLMVPMHLCRELLPYLRKQPRAHILNVGSVFGSIGYPGFSVYSATKFGLRGFTEALRRELCGSNIGVHYLAPRATRTSMNSAATDAMNQELNIAVDAPPKVARAMCRMLEREDREAVIGWPEKFFARINALLPALVDRSVSRRLPIIERHARHAASGQENLHGGHGQPTIKRVIA